MSEMQTNETDIKNFWYFFLLSIDIHGLY